MRILEEFEKENEYNQIILYNYFIVLISMHWCFVRLRVSDLLEL